MRPEGERREAKLSQLELLGLALLERGRAEGTMVPSWMWSLAGLCPQPGKVQLCAPGLGFAG